jgi:hypothetical protein
MTTYYNFPIAIFRQVRTDKGAIKHVEKAINEAIDYALYEAYRKLMPPQANPNAYNAGVYKELMQEMGFEDKNPEHGFNKMIVAYRVNKKYSVIVGADKDLLFDFRDNLVYKTDFEIIQLLTFLAIRSIIGAGVGNMRVKHIPWHYVLSRMAGHEKAVSNLDTLPEFISKYDSRRLHDKLIKALCDRWHMQYHGKNLGKGVAPLFTFSQSIDLELLVDFRRDLLRECKEAGLKVPANLLLKKAIERYNEYEKIGRELERGEITPAGPKPPDPVIIEKVPQLPSIFGSLAGGNKTNELW